MHGGMGNANDVTYDAIYQKLWLAHAIYDASWDGKKHRLGAEEPVYAVLTAADQQHPAWWQYSTLMGRSEEFFHFIEARLGVTPANYGEKLQDAWETVVTPRVANYVRTNITNNKIVRWPLPVV
ncbi:MAG: hypothetical protein C7B44_06720 [Sulfobacillus thermosulfidooxidans]|uniref:Uncharacterized protein n=2 Tax=Clostridiales Family XVII. Incertae Sedis TaxID=539000 RepID=A0ABM6RRW8_9FIRM|nr:hypothetical protein BXT84_09050 [Sulfobacillus thermotolerans]POB12027.1 hypothetical protein CO251_01690 [Sulfobacillus sp. hq2]PSR36885.1 MAG: hypothetical protein C7B44_06720 [Sulfobacillus thermosulfidooxidans]